MLRGVWGNGDAYMHMVRHPMALEKLGEDSTPGTVKPVPVSLVEPVAYQSQLTGGTINQRVAIVERALRTVFPDAPAQIAPGFQHTYWQPAPMGIGRPRLALSRLRVKTPKRTISPLSVDEVARF